MANQMTGGIGAGKSGAFADGRIVRGRQSWDQLFMAFFIVATVENYATPVLPPRWNIAVGALTLGLFSCRRFRARVLDWKARWESRPE